MGQAAFPTPRGRPISGASKVGKRARGDRRGGAISNRVCDRVRGMGGITEIFNNMEADMEKTVERYLRLRVRDAGGLALKWLCPGWNGVPDRIILMPDGKVFFAETKDAGKKPGPRQRRVHEILQGLGFTIYVPDSKAAVDRLMREVLGE